MAVILQSVVNSKLTGASKAAFAAIRELLSYKVEGMAANATDRWSGMNCFLEMDGTFPSGFTSLVHAKLNAMKEPVQVIRKPLPPALGPEHPVVDSFPEDPRYDYQRQVVEKLERYGQIIAQVATGGGKSRIAKLAYSRIGRKTLFLTTRSILMYQMGDAMGELIGKKNVGIIGDGVWKPSEGFNVGMVQSLMARLAIKDHASGTISEKKRRESEETIKLLEEFEFIIMEEAHEGSSESFYTLMRLCKNAAYRLALTATPFMKSSEEANMRLMAAAGPVAIKVSEKLLIDRGILAKPFFKFVRLDDPMPICEVEVRDIRNQRTGNWQKTYLTRTTPWPKAYEIGITGNMKRNLMVCGYAKIGIQYGMSVMVLVQQQEHGKILQRMLTENGVRCVFIFGQHNQDERNAAIRALKQGKIDVLIGSTILDVGVDVPAVGMIIIASGGKAEVATRQRIGRGLRAKKIGPNLCWIIDFDDWQNNHLRAHSAERRSIIETTPGFVEGIVEEFEFEKYGYQKAA